MDFRNVLMAIVLSTLVLVGWATFFEAPIVEQQTTENGITKNEDLSSPSIDENEKEIKNEITRNEVINNTKRIKVENENIKGSISLQGAIIDDIIFKNYNETLNGENKVNFLNPKNSSKEYSDVIQLKYWVATVALIQFPIRKKARSKWTERMYYWQ